MATSDLSHAPVWTCLLDAKGSAARPECVVVVTDLYCPSKGLWGCSAAALITDRCCEEEEEQKEEECGLLNITETSWTSLEMTYVESFIFPGYQVFEGFFFASYQNETSKI